MEIIAPVTEVKRTKTKPRDLMPGALLLDE
jgi:hypothetical protein